MQTFVALALSEWKSPQQELFALLTQPPKAAHARSFLLGTAANPRVRFRSHSLGLNVFVEQTCRSLSWVPPANLTALMQFADQCAIDATKSAPCVTGRNGLGVCPLLVGAATCSALAGGLLPLSKSFCKFGLMPAYAVPLDL